LGIYRRRKNLGKLKQLKSFLDARYQCLSYKDCNC
jgi:hypothetical protein